MIIYSPEFPQIKSGTAVRIGNGVYRIEGAPLPAGAIALPDWSSGDPLPPQIAAAKRTEIRAAKANALTLAIGSDTEIRGAMADADTLINLQHMRPLTDGEEAALAIYAAAKDVSDLINEQQDALLAAIDAAEAAGDIPALLAIAWGDD